jgi:hypothetical protein
MVNRLHGLLGLEWAIVSAMLLPPPTCSARSPPSWADSVVPSGRTTTDDPTPGVDREGRGEACESGAECV